MTGSMADESFRYILDELKKDFQKIGYRKNRYFFKKNTNRNVAIVGFQRSVNSTKNVILFTVNLAVVCRKLADPETDDISKLGISDAHLRQRLGAFVSHPTDKWWELSPDVDVNAVLHEIAALIFPKAIPYLESFLDNQKLIQLWEAGRSPGLTDSQRRRFLTELKQREALV